MIPLKSHLSVYKIKFQEWPFPTWKRLCSELVGVISKKPNKALLFILNHVTHLHCAALLCCLRAQPLAKLKCFNIKAKGIHSTSQICLDRFPHPSHWHVKWLQSQKVRTISLFWPNGHSTFSYWAQTIWRWNMAVMKLFKVELQLCSLNNPHL